jgi:hypothetical protein
MDAPHTFLFYDYIPTLADHVIDFPKERYTCWGITPKHIYPPFDVNSVKDNDIVFVKTDLLPQFFHHLYGKIKKRFILLTGVAGLDVGPAAARFLEEDKIIRWIGCNLCFQHPKAVKIPIAFEEPERRRGGTADGDGGDQQLLRHLYANSKSATNKIDKLLITYIGQTHGTRRNVKDYFSGKDFVNFADKMDFENYMNTINDYKFVLCPRGCGTDTHRFWEVSLMGSIPVVERNGLWDLYDKFPCIIVDSFAQVTREVLDAFIPDIEKRKNIERYLVIQYFNEGLKKIIDSVANSV